MLVRFNKKLSLLIIGIVMPILFMIWKFSQPVLPKTYQEAVQYTKAINMKEMRSKLANGDEFVVYIGRESCPYCQKFVPNLALAIQKSHQTVYYLDSDSDEKDEITAFAKEMDIQTVPNLSVYQNGSKSRYLEQGSSASLEEILSFLKHEQDRKIILNDKNDSENWNRGDDKRGWIIFQPLLCILMELHTTINDNGLACNVV